MSFPILAEIHEVLSRKDFSRYIDEKSIRDFVTALTRESEWVNVTGPITACRDPKDNKFLELAVSGNATHIVTGDADLLTLNPFKEIQIISPAAFLDVGRG